MQISEDALKQAYRQMKTIRMFEERLHDEIMTGEIAGFTHLYAGQEAVAVGVCEHLDYNDTISSTHRGHGHCIAKGCDVKGMMLEIYGRADGICKGKGGSMHIADIEKGMLGANGIVGGGPPIVVGAALAAKSDRTASASSQGRPAMPQPRDRRPAQRAHGAPGRPGASGAPRRKGRYRGRHRGHCSDGAASSTSPQCARRYGLGGAHSPSLRGDLWRR